MMDKTLYTRRKSFESKVGMSTCFSFTNATIPYLSDILYNNVNNNLFQLSDTGFLNFDKDLICQN